MKIASILSIVALIASMATNGCSEDGPVTNPRQEEPQKVVKEEGFAPVSYTHLTLPTT